MTRKLRDLKPDKKQVRKNIDPKSLEELKASIWKHGFLHPLVIDQDDNIICGHRRYQAAKEMKIPEVPVTVREYNGGIRERMLMQLTENLQRQNLTPLEELNAYRQLHATYQMRQVDIAARTGKSESFICGALAARDRLPDDAIENGSISNLIEIAALPYRKRKTFIKRLQNGKHVRRDEIRQAKNEPDELKSPPSDHVERKINWKERFEHLQETYQTLQRELDDQRDLLRQEAWTDIRAVLDEVDDERRPILLSQLEGKWAA